MELAADVPESLRERTDQANLQNLSPTNFSLSLLLQSVVVAIKATLDRKRQPKKVCRTTALRIWSAPAERSVDGALDWFSWQAAEERRAPLRSYSNDPRTGTK